MPRLVIVSNRLPITVRVRHGRLEVGRSPGGLANGLRGPHARLDGVWVGWPGELGLLDINQSAMLARRLTELRLVPVALSPSEVTRFYEGFSNGVLWPLFHYLLDRVPLDTRDWGVYARVNQRFAEAAAAAALPGDLVWVHDYQLTLVPAALRRLRPDLKVGFFLHIPFPAAEVMRTLPRRRELLEGILGADLVGFHTRTYLRHFVDSCRGMLAGDASEQRVRIQGREVRLGVFPMGVDAAAIGEIASSPGILEAAAALRPPTGSTEGGERLLLGIDRLDYTKGIPRRFLALERLLERTPRLRGRVRMVEIAVPSRERLDAYRALRRQVEEMVGRINGLYGTSQSAPIHYVYRNLSEQQVIALYRAAEVMVVTPLRDGMNLVAKEFVAARTDEDGVLVLSELAGASEELNAALKVNPYDISGMADTFRRALAMPAAERKARMGVLRARVLAYDVHAWAQDFIGALEARPALVPPPRPGEGGPRLDARAELRARLGAGERLVVLLDYDGTLVPFAGRPELAFPDEELLGLLAALADRPRTEVHVVSGRRRDDLESWLGHLPIGLHAEHGLWMRPDARGDWTRTDTTGTGWMDIVIPAVEAAVGRIPGSFIERKTASVAFHYRLARDIDLEESLCDLRHQLHELARWLPLDVLDGSAVIEVRTRGVHKGRVAAWLRAAGRLSGTVLAIGDDHTDEDLFAALPADALTVMVGERTSLARMRLQSPAEVRALLRTVAGLTLAHTGNERD